MNERRLLVSRHLAHLGIGSFAGICAAFVPRLAIMIGQQSSSEMLNVVIFSRVYLIVSIAFALLIGGIVLVFEWNGKGSPRDIFMSALAVPALLTGAFNSAAVSVEAKRLAEEKVQTSRDRAQAEGIEIEDADGVTESSSIWMPSLLPVAFAKDQSVRTVSDAKKQTGFGIRYRELQYWVTVGVYSTKAEAQAKLAEIEDRSESLKIVKLGDKYYITLDGRSFPYSQAVSEAIELKKESNGVLRPRLIRAQQ